MDVVVLDKDAVMREIRNGVNKDGGALMLMEDHLAGAQRQLDILKGLETSEAHAGGQPSQAASDAMFTLFSRAASALDASIVYLFPIKYEKGFKDFMRLARTCEHPNKIIDLSPSFEAVDNFTIAANEAGTTVFNVNDFWNVIKHRQFGRVQVASRDTRSRSRIARFHLGTVFYDIVPAAQRWFDAVSAWIGKVKTVGVLVPDVRA